MQMTHSSFEQEFDSLLEKYTELLTGQASPLAVEKVKRWAMYNHIHKTMPNLTAHWSQTHPEARAEVRKLFEEIRDLNQALRAAQAPTDME
jgi:hypothetical protein